MYKLKNYFCISQFLAHFEKQENNRLSIKIDRNKPLKSIEKLYQTYNEQEVCHSALYEFFKHTRTILLSLIFTIVMLFSFISIQKSINIKIYLVFGIIIPFLYLLYVAWQTLFYKFPNKEESSLVAFFAKKYPQYDRRDTHIFKTFTTLLFVEMGIVYTFSILLSTIFIFWAYSIEFYSESSYAFLDPVKIWFGVTNGSGHTILPQHFFAIAITLSIIILLLLKSFIWLLAKKNLQKAMNQALLQKAQTLLQQLSQSVEIQVSNNTKNTIENFETQTKAEQQIDRSHYDLLFYQFTFNEKIVNILELQNDSDLSNLQAEYYSFALYGEEQEDDKTIKKLQNLVIVVTSPQTLPDNTFKDDMLAMLETNRVRQIWIIPLVEKDGIFQKAYKGDYLYEEWQKQINETIGDYRIRLYNEK
ncbi:hypothetical protein MNB_SM-6-1340 [hydrothermal vent metagenome]|uniref:DUF2868 domain-containing protein n=1 Tax=hydrothermal vent metagenome TaxID=652676 RepID=A0A1W1BN31_9ZZZZ